MVCKFCGSTLEDNELECPYCGHKTDVQPRVESASEFDYDYDYEESAPKSKGLNIPNVFSKKSSVSKQEYEYDAEPEYEEPAPKRSSRSSFSGQPSVNKGLGSFPLIVMSGISALLALFCLVSVISMKGKIKDLEQTMLSQFYAVQTATNDISGKLDAVNGSVSSVGTAIQTANDSKNITITRNPQSDATLLGRGGEEDDVKNRPLFYAEADGAIKTVEWQVKENGEWVTINWDNESNNLTYGLHVYNDIGPTHTNSQMASHGITAEAFNKQYRCVFYDSFGSKATDPATLTERFE